MSLLDGIQVEAYGSKVPINQVSTLSVPEPAMIVAQPFDPSLMGAIEKAIRTSDLGLNPANDGKVVRIPIPALTEDRRKDMVKLAGKMAEEGRVAVRNVRRDVMSDLKAMSKELGEDEVRRAEGDLQKITDEHVAEIDKALKGKEAEIMEV